MNIITISQKMKYKHLNFHHYEFIIGKTQFIRNLTSSVGASVCNIYSIMKDATITVKDTHLVENEVLSNKFSSIDETIDSLILHHPERIKGMTTISTKTFYNYVHQSKVSIQPIDLPRMLRRKSKKNCKTYIPKRHKGTSIDHRPAHVLDRLEFGHWEGDLVTGPRNGQNGALLTLIERKTRFYYMIPVKDKSSKQVYMKINQLHKLYGPQFSQVFKSITFDNGNGLARYFIKKVLI